MTKIQVIAAAPAARSEADAAMTPPFERTGGGWSSARRVGFAFLAGGTVILAVALVARAAPGADGFVTTDNAYVEGNVTFISPKVQGYVTAVLAEDDQIVKPGQVLLRIDPTDYKSATADGEAAVEQAKASLAQVVAQRALQQAQIRVSDAGITSARATVSRARADLARANALVGKGFVSRQFFESAEADSVRAGSAATQAEAQADYARKQLGVLEAQQFIASAQIASSEARLVRARADLQRTSVLAPREGRVAARTVRLGEFVNTGTRLLAITPTTGLWVVANLRETQLSRIRPGDRVQVAVDAVPNAVFCGRVEGTQGASGSEFAVIPPDNATGNFTKIVRRFAVRILLDASQPDLDRLSAGMSVTPRIEVGSHGKTRRGASLLSRLVRGSFACDAGK